MGRGSQTSSEATKMSDESTHVSLFPAHSPRRFVALAPLRFPSPTERQGEGRIDLPLLYKLNNNAEPPPSHFYYERGTKKESESPTGFEPITSQTPGCLIFILSIATALLLRYRRYPRRYLEVSLIKVIMIINCSSV